MHEATKKGNEARANSETLVEWYGKLAEAYRTLPEEKKRELDEW